MKVWWLPRAPDKLDDLEINLTGAEKTMADPEFFAAGDHLPVVLAFTVTVAPVVDKVGWSNNTVLKEATKPKKTRDALVARTDTVTGSFGFHGVPEKVWNFHIGGHQVCERLKDRKGRTGRRTHPVPPHRHRSARNHPPHEGD